MIFLTLTKEFILHNRKKFIEGLQEPHRLKHKEELEDLNQPNKRCCLGHGCQIFGFPRNIKLGVNVQYFQNYAIAPEALVHLLGLNNYIGSIYADLSLAALNDETNKTIQEIGKYLEPNIEGGKKTPFISIDEYPKQVMFKKKEQEEFVKKLIEEFQK